MDFDKIFDLITQKSQPRFFRFEAEQDSRGCKLCRSYAYRIFRENDPEIPALPLHPHCRCELVPVSNDEVRSIQKSLREMEEEAARGAAKISQAIQSCLAALREMPRQIWDRTKASAGEAAKNAQDRVISDLYFHAKVAARLIFTEEKLRKTLDDFCLTPVPQEELFKLEKNLREVYDTLKELHYSRLNDPWQDPDVLPKSPEEALKSGFVRAKDSENRYHINKGEVGNVKYIHKGLGLEIIFDKNGKRVTTPENIGTLNYGPEPWSSAHILFDILPYWLWGNSPQDSTPLWYRIVGRSK